MSGSSQGGLLSSPRPNCYGATGAAPLGGIACGGVVASAAAGPRQDFQSKITNPLATTSHTATPTQDNCARAAPTSMVPASRPKVPSAACITRVMNTLPPVWLKTHVATKVNVNAPRSPAGGELVREDERHMLEGYERREDEGGEKRRTTGSLQSRKGDASPTRLLAHRPIQGVDQSYREHHEDGGQGGQGCQ